MKIVSAAALLAASLGIATTAAATTPEYDQPVTPDAIFGSGNDNGGYTVSRKHGIEVGLRGKVRFPVPLNQFNSNGDGTYSFDAGDACPGFSFAGPPLCLATPVWSFEWSINTDYDGTTGKFVGDYVYELGMDADPGHGTDYTVFDNITPSLIAPLFDHAFGVNGTANGAGVEAADPATYATYLGLYNVAQNSWNYEFFNNLGTSLASFDPAVDGNYKIYLKVKHPGTGHVVNEVEIQILVGDAEAIGPPKPHFPYFPPRPPKRGPWWW